MTLQIEAAVYAAILRNGEEAYPDEGAGLLLGKVDGDRKSVTAVLPLSNKREDLARRNRYLLAPEDYLRGEQEAERLGLEVLGIFHSHPDHPDRPSEFDREWAMPWFSYLITCVLAGKAAGSRSWRLTEDRSAFLEETLNVTQQEMVAQGPQ
ncbi:MAG: M67 family metallopeptidase [Omnitrophica WOR_2 bacterium]